RMVGGTVNTNKLGGILATTVAGGFDIIAVDFEQAWDGSDHAGSHQIPNMISLSGNVNPFYIVDNNFATAASAITNRGILIQDCHRGFIRLGRFNNGIAAGQSVPLLSINEDCSNVDVDDFVGVNNTIVEHRGYWT